MRSDLITPLHAISIVLLTTVLLNLLLYLYSPLLYMNNTALFAVVLTGGYLFFLHYRRRKGFGSRGSDLYAALCCVGCFLVSGLLLVGILRFIDTGLVSTYIQAEMDSLIQEVLHMEKQGMEVEIDYNEAGAKIKMKYETTRIIQRFSLQSLPIALISFFISPNSKTNENQSF